MNLSPEMAVAIGKIGATMALIFSAAGSALGTGIAGTAAVGAWKKCFSNNKPATFLLSVFAGAPITQTFYGLILMFLLNRKASEIAFPALLGWGFFGGLGIGLSALMQGIAAAASADAFAETGQGFTNYLLALGIIEGVAIFIMVFIAITIG